MNLFVGVYVFFLLCLNHTAFVSCLLHNSPPGLCFHAPCVKINSCSAGLKNRVLTHSVKLRVITPTSFLLINPDHRSCPPTPPLTLTLTSHLGQNVGLGEGQVGSFSETYNEGAMSRFFDNTVEPKCDNLSCATTELSKTPNFSQLKPYNWICHSWNLPKTTTFRKRTRPLLGDDSFMIFLHFNLL